MLKIFLYPIILATGMGLFVFSEHISQFIEKKFFSHNSSANIVAKVNSMQEIARIWEKNTLIALKNQQSLFNDDQISVPKNNSITLIFPLGYEIKFSGKGSFKLQNKSTDNTPITVIHLFSGKIEVLKKGAEGSVQVSYQQKLYPPHEVPDHLITIVKLSDKEAHNLEVKKGAHLKLAPLTNHSLKQAIKDQKGYLYIQRCYASHLRKYPTLKGGGKMTIYFTAQPKGTLTYIKIINSNFNDAQDFHRCIKTVFARIRLKPFTGKEVNVSFPLNLF